MNRGRIALWVLTLAASLASVGCGKAIRFDTDQPEKEEEPPKVEDSEPLRPPSGPQPRLVGLPLMGSQIDVLGVIEFDSGSATIKDHPNNVALIETLVAAGNAYKQITRLRVEGHTDSDGDEQANQKLSERRAEAVVERLTSRGIDRSRLRAVGCGERDPLSPNTSAENKQRNRRTEFDIEEIDGKRFELATGDCEPNTHRRGYVTLTEGSWDGSAFSFTLDRAVYNHTQEVKITYMRPMKAPKGQQFWIAMVPRDEPDSRLGQWHYITDGAKTDRFEIFKSTETEYEIRLHDIYPHNPTKVLQRTGITVKR
jgi:OOP family OmpA-OmpF porin